MSSQNENVDSNGSKFLLLANIVPVLGLASSIVIYNLTLTMVLMALGLLVVLANIIIVTKRRSVYLKGSEKTLGWILLVWSIVLIVWLGAMLYGLSFI